MRAPFRAPFRKLCRSLATAIRQFGVLVFCHELLCREFFFAASLFTIGLAGKAQATGQRCDRQDFSEIYYLTSDGQRRFDIGVVPLLVPTGTPIYQAPDGAQTHDLPPGLEFMIVDPGPGLPRLKIQDLNQVHEGWVDKSQILCSRRPLWDSRLSVSLRVIRRDAQTSMDSLAVYDQQGTRFLVGPEYDSTVGTPPALTWFPSDELILWRSGLGWRPGGDIRLCLFTSLDDMARERGCRPLRAGAFWQDRTRHILILDAVPQGYSVAVPGIALNDGPSDQNTAIITGYVRAGASDIRIERRLTQEEAALWRAYLRDFADLLDQLITDRKDVLDRVAQIFQDYPGTLAAPAPDRETTLSRMLVLRGVPGAASSGLNFSPSELENPILFPACRLAYIARALRDASGRADGTSPGAADLPCHSLVTQALDRLVHLQLPQVAGPNLNSGFFAIRRSSQ